MIWEKDACEVQDGCVLLQEKSEKNDRINGVLVPLTYQRQTRIRYDAERTSHNFLGGVATMTLPQWYAVYSSQRP